MPLCLHFATRRDKPAVFKLTAALVAQAQARARSPAVDWTVGDDMGELSWLARADGLVTSNDVLCDPAFPLRDLARAAPRLRWIQTIAAG